MKFATIVNYKYNSFFKLLQQGSSSLPREDTSFNEACNSSEQQQQRERCLSDDGRAQQVYLLLCF